MKLHGTACLFAFVMLSATGCAVRGTDHVHATAATGEGEAEADHVDEPLPDPFKDKVAPDIVVPAGQEASAAEYIPPPVARSDDGPGGQRPTGISNDTRALAGWWDYTRIGPSGEDIAVFSISPDGVVTEYDYQADAVGSGRECYQRVATEIAARGNDRYDIMNSSMLPGSGSSEDVLIRVEADELVFRYLGKSPDPAYGEWQSGITERYPAVANRNSMEPLEVCSN